VGESNGSQAEVLRGRLADGAQVVIGQFAPGSDAATRTTSTGGSPRNGQ